MPAIHSTEWFARTVVVNTDKSRVVKTNENQFLDFTFKASRIHWHPKRC